MSETNAVLIRPGCTDFDEQNRIQGTLDIPLNDHGQDQVRQMVEALRDVPLQAIYSAPCEPARSTAEALAAELGVPVKEVEGLSNLNQGLWQGMSIEDIRRKHPKVYKQWLESPETICPPEGEEWKEATQRVTKAIGKILKKKTDVAIIAPEPMASLIRRCICGGKVRTIEPIESCGLQQHWEILSTNGTTKDLGEEAEE